MTTCRCRGQRALRARARLAAVIGAGGELSAATRRCSSGWTRPSEPDVKQSDFSLLLGPTVVTPDEIDPGVGRRTRFAPAGGRSRAAPDGFSWPDALALAAPADDAPARATSSPGHRLLTLDGVGSAVELEVEGIGTLRCPVA